MTSTPQPAQAGLGARAHVSGRPSMPQPPRSLRASENLVASCTSSRRPAIASPTSSSLWPLAVDVGGVEEGDAEVERAVDRGDRLVSVGGAVGLAHAHAAQAEAGDDQAVAERAGSDRRCHARILPRPVIAPPGRRCGRPPRRQGEAGDREVGGDALRRHRLRDHDEAVVEVPAQQDLCGADVVRLGDLAQHRVVEVACSSGRCSPPGRCRALRDRARPRRRTASAPTRSG